MKPDQWDSLSEWHGAWLAGDAAERRRLRDELAASAPDLVADADELIAGNAPLDRFLETPAFMLTARQLAFDTAGLAPDTQVGPYRVRQLIARGGMGIVYRATDTRLDRDVALKMLALVDDPDGSHVARFLSEARLTASVDHPNVVKIFDVGLHDGQPFMVVELLEGETLRQRLDRGALTEVAARQIAVEVAKGLAAAASAGLVHRDLKPENIFVTGSGVCKILDFGIAKLAPDAAGRHRGGSTLTGILLGTAGYLAPEQIRGEDADGRADLFALGSILFEMLTGQRAFACENTVDTLHAILHEPARDLLEDGRDISPSMGAIVARLLEKDPSDRFQSAADLAWALENESGTAPIPRAPRRSAARSGRRLSSWMAAPAAALVIAGAWWMGTRTASDHTTAARVAKFAWTLPTGTGMFSAPTVSPDGRRIAWSGVSEKGVSRLYVRDLASSEAAFIPATEGARYPFWSPDSRWIGYFARGKLAKVEAAGGPPVMLTDVGDGRGGAWSRLGVIVFQPEYRDSPLLRIPDTGGTAEQPATAFDAAQEDVIHKFPVFLPDGRHFVYLGVTGRDERRGIYLGSLDDNPPRPGRLLFTSDAAAVYAPLPGRSDGVLLSVGTTGIEARPFDPARLQLTGDPQALGIEAAGVSPYHSQLTASGDVIAYLSSMVPWGGRFGSIARDGSDLRLPPEHQLGGFPRVSPDGRLLARTRVDQIRGNPDIWVDDLERGTELRLTNTSSHDVVPVWSPDGQEVVFRSGTVPKPTIAFATADGRGITRTLPCPAGSCEPSDWSPDGKTLFINVNSSDIWTLPLPEGGPARPFLVDRFVERDGRIRADGRWLAYVSDESGKPEVSVRSVSGPPRRFVVSRGGGDQPVWRHDGAELFFTGPDNRLVSVQVRSVGEGLTFGQAVKLPIPALGERHWGALYDVSHDGRRVYFLHPTGEKPPSEFGIVMGWSGLLKSDVR